MNDTRIQSVLFQIQFGFSWNWEHQLNQSMPHSSSLDMSTHPLHGSSGISLGRRTGAKGTYESFRIIKNTKSVSQISGRFIFFANNYSSTPIRATNIFHTCCRGKILHTSFLLIKPHSNRYIVVLESICNLGVLFYLIWKPVHRSIFVLLINCTTMRYR